jgi:hypothetical protein
VRNRICLPVFFAEVCQKLCNKADLETKSRKHSFPSEEKSFCFPFRPPDGASDDDGLVFSRNERFDVKKPGPFFPNSANNFFLNKVILWGQSN